MSINVEELVAGSENETSQFDASERCPDDSNTNPNSLSDESAKEIFRRESNTSTRPASAPAYAPKQLSKTALEKPKSSYVRISDTTKKVPVSNIPKRLKSNIKSTTPSTTKQGSYRQTPPSPMPTTMKKTSLEVQFMNQKKRLMLLHAEIAEKQRPLLDIHKSLLRTKKQLEGLGRKVVLEDLKIISLNEALDKPAVERGAGGECINNETVDQLKSSIDVVFETCVKVCQKCFVQRDDVLKLMENVACASDPADLQNEVEDMMREKNELEKCVENAINESEKVIGDLLENLKKTPQAQEINDEMKEKISELEAKVKQQQKIISDAEDGAVSLNRKFEDKKATLERAIVEQQEKMNKLEEEIKKEKKNATDTMMKNSRYRTKIADYEGKARDADERTAELTNKLKKLEEQLRKKEIQWLKEKEDFKKNEALLQQKFAEKQSQFDTRLKELEERLKDSEMLHQESSIHMETEIVLKEQELTHLEKEKMVLSQHSEELERQLEEMRKQLEEKEKEVDELNEQNDSMPTIDYHNENDWVQLEEYQKKIAEVQETVGQQSEQISKMQSSLKAHAQLAVALKLEKDNAIKYAKKLREILQEARDEIEFKNKTIYKIHEKLVLNEAAYEKMKKQIKEYDMLLQYANAGQPRTNNKCQICMNHLVGGEIRQQQTDCLSNAETEGASLHHQHLHPQPNSSHLASNSSPNTTTNNNSPRTDLVSGSLIGMSVEKVDKLRARLDNLKKITVVTAHPRRRRCTAGNLNKLRQTWSNQTCAMSASQSSHSLHKEIQLRGKLYKILQKHADQSCEDFINLLKLTVSQSGKINDTSGMDDELNPSNLEDVQYCRKPKKYSSNIQITESFTEVIDSVPRQHNVFTRKSVIFENDDSDNS